MPTKENLKYHTEEVTWNKAGQKRKYGHKIIKTDTGYEIILFKSRDKNYKGIGLEMNFENFASDVRMHNLRNVPHNQIKWFQWDQWEADCYEDRLLPVKMDFDGKRYSNPVWGKEIKFEE